MPCRKHERGSDDPGELVAQLLELDRSAPDRPVSLYINSPGGPFSALAAVHDTMRHLSPEVETTCTGTAEGTAALLLAAGAPGRRLVLPTASACCCASRAEEAQGRVSDLAIQAQHVRRTRELMVELLAPTAAARRTASRPTCGTDGI